MSREPVFWEPKLPAPILALRRRRPRRLHCVVR